MKLTSSAFDHNQKIPVVYTCDGQKINPPLAISGVPKEAKSLALIVEDPDAPTGTFVHWIVWNIDPETLEIPEGSVPEKSQEGLNGAGKEGYVGPCPPTGQHRYFFTLYALDTTLGLNGQAKREDLDAAMQGHITAQATLVGVYRR